MLIWKKSVRWIVALVIASLTALAGFGLALAGLWALIGPRADLKLTAAFLSAGFGLGLGGFVAGRILPSQGPAAPALFGLLFGWASFAYILGSDPRVIVLAAASVLLAVAGSLISPPIRDAPAAAGSNAGAS